MEKINVFSPAGMPGVQVWDVKNSPRTCRQYHETYSICAVRSSPRNAADWRYRGKYHRTQSGEIMLMEPGELHVTNRLVGLSSYVVLFLPQDIVKNLLREEIKSAPHFKTACLRNKDMTKAFLQLHASLTTQSTTLEKQSLLTQCFSRLFQEAGENMAALSCENRKIDLTHVQDYLQAHWNKDVGLDELARLAGTNRYRLLRSFSHQFGLPPHAYQLQVRIERARLLLKKGAGFSSLDLGFSDQSHFIRHFKRLLGLTPGQYASQIK